MLAKLTSKNQLTLPKAVVGQFPGAAISRFAPKKGASCWYPRR
jgi:hypothetical protein